MRKIYFRHFIFLFLIVSLTFLFSSATFAETPLVIVVHGVGDGNQADGWSKDLTKNWQAGDVKEITFRYQGRTVPSSFTDFAQVGGDWALSVQKQLKQILAENPDRPVILVTHSWGSVVTSIALSGGEAGGSSKELEAQDFQIPSLNLDGRRIQEWVTLASPLGRANANVPFNLQQLNVNVLNGKPNQVDHWTNIYDVNDPISNQSHHLPGADNIEVSDSASSFGPWNWLKNTFTRGIAAHRGIWTSPEVAEKIHEYGEKLNPPESEETKPVQVASQPSTPSPSKVQAPPPPKPATPVQPQAAPPAAPPVIPKPPVIASTPTTPKLITFTVTVVDEKNQPINNAAINISGPKSGNQVTANGQAVFNTPDTGTYAIDVSAQGYEAVQSSVTLPPDQQIIPVTLKKSAVATAGGNVSFAILFVDAHGTRIPNVNVQLSGPGQASGVAANGVINFDNLPEGTYSLTAQAKGFKSETMPLTVVPDMGGEIGNVTGVTVLMEPLPGTVNIQTQNETATSFVGNWSGTTRMLSDSSGLGEVGKVTPLKVKITSDNNGYVIYCDPFTIKNGKDFGVSAKDKVITITYNSTQFKIVVTLTLDGNIINLAATAHGFHKNKSGVLVPFTGQYSGVLNRTT